MDPLDLLACLDFLDLRENLVILVVQDCKVRKVPQVCLASLVLKVLQVLQDLLVFLELLVLPVLPTEMVLSSSLTVRPPTFLNVLKELRNFGMDILCSTWKEMRRPITKILDMLVLACLASPLCHSCSVTSTMSATMPPETTRVTGSPLELLFL